MTNIAEESPTIPSLKKLSEVATAESDAATGQPNGSPGESGERDDRRPSAPAAPQEGHVPHRIAFDSSPSTPPTGRYQPSATELQLAAKLGISADVVCHNSAPGSPTGSRPASFRPILKSVDHHSHLDHQGAPTSSGTDTRTPSIAGEHAAEGSGSTEPKRRVSIVVSDEATKRANCSCKANGLDSPRKRISSCTCDSRFGSRAGLADGGSVPSTPKLSGRTSLQATTPLATITAGRQHEFENGKSSATVEQPKTKQTRSFIECLYTSIYPQRPFKQSAWYLFCQRCRKDTSEDEAEPWEPPHWQAVCPYPFCPTYRQFARVTAITLVVLLLWGSVYSVVGAAAGPGGQLFSLALLTIAAHFGGWLIALTTLPKLIGMLLVGILFQNVGLFHVSGEFHEILSILRKIALVIILTRAGLDLDHSAMKRLFFTILKLGLVPWLADCVVIAVTTYFLLGLPWVWGFLVGSVVAAVSPAVVVPCLIRLRSKGYGVAKGIPTLIIAISGIDDAASVAVFGIILSIMFSNDSLAYQIAQGPLSVVVGVGFGILWGILAKYIPEKNDPFVVPLRVLLLFGGGLISVLGSESIGLGGAGPLAVVAAAFVSCYSWTQHGWEVEDNPVATTFEIFWMIFEPILFGLTGTQVKLNELDPHKVSLIVACLLSGIVIRIAVTVLIAFRNKLNLREKFFVSISCMSKASVQAALGPVVLDTVREARRDSETDETYAMDVLVVCVMSIVMTAPLSAFLITILGPRLLTKTTVDPQFPENWRRHTRPSLRDITIIDEDEETNQDAESGTATPTSSIRGSGRRRRRSTRSGNTLPPTPIDTVS